MVLYKCNRCSKIFYHKNDYNKHIKRKNPCKINPHKLTQSGGFVPQKNGENLTCSGCNKTFSRQDTLTRHTMRYCKPKQQSENCAVFPHSDLRTSPQYILYDYDNDQIVCSYDFRDDSVFSPQKPQKTLKTEFSPQKTISPIDEEDLICNFCQKTFTRNDNLIRHINKYCKVKKQDDMNKEILFRKLINDMESLKKENKQIMNENNQLKKQINHIEIKNNNIDVKNYNTINNKTVNNNNLNINLVAFGKEDMSSITDNVCKSILNKGFQSVPKLVEYVHFNKNRPEHHNVYISNMRDNYVMVYDGKKWNLGLKDEVIDQILDEKRMFLVEKFEDLISELNPFTIKKFRRFLDSQDEDQVANNIKKDIKLILYNNKKIPEETRKLLNDYEKAMKANKLLKYNSS